MPSTALLATKFWVVLLALLATKFSVMLVSVDDLLHTLRQSYDLKRDESAPLPDKGEMCQRITATRQRGATAPGPRRVQMWLDAQTHIVKRMELSWDPPAGPRGGPGAHERPGPA